MTWQASMMARWVMMPCRRGALRTARSPVTSTTDCPNGGSTSLTGTVYDLAGHTPLYGAVVLVPNDPANLPPIVTGANSCNSCEASIGDYVTVSVTDATGNFTIKNVPTGREMFRSSFRSASGGASSLRPAVPDCMATPVPHDLTRLPRNQAEGHLPQMALLTGGCDNVACFLRSVGVDASEFSSPHAGGRVDVYQGLGARGHRRPPVERRCRRLHDRRVSPLEQQESLQAYDAVLLGCECGEEQPRPSPPRACWPCTTTSIKGDGLRDPFAGHGSRTAPPNSSP